MKLPLFIAKRYLVSKKSHHAINIISIISIIGISIGTLALVVVLSAFNGLSDLVQSLYNSFDPDIEITIKEGKTFNPDTPEFQAIRKLEGVAYFSETIEENALLKYNDQQSIATLKGVDQEFEQMTHFDTLVENGEFILEEGQHSFAVVGKGIAYLLDLNTSDIFSPISIYVPRRGTTINPSNPEEAFNEGKTYASGIFTINDDFDFKYVILPINFVRKLLDYKNEVSAIEIGLKPGYNRDKIQEAIEAIAGDKHLVKNKDQQNQVLFKTLKSEKLWTFIILVFILVIATFNVIGSLTILMIEKKKDIIILRDMGADIQMIRKIFLWEGMMITFVGAISGLILGVLICAVQIFFSPVKFNEGYVVDAYPVAIQVLDLVFIFFTVALIGLFASWYPVRVFTKRQLRG